MGLNRWVPGRCLRDRERVTEVLGPRTGEERLQDGVGSEVLRVRPGTESEGRQGLYTETGVKTTYLFGVMFPCHRPGGGRVSWGSESCGTTRSVSCVTPT